MRRGSTRTRFSVLTGGRPRRRRTKLARSFRVLLALAVAACGLVVAGAIIAKGARPYLISHGEAKEIAQIKQQIAQSEAEKRALKKNIEYVQTPQGKEAEARKLGWVKEGEIAVVLEAPQGSEGANGQPSDSAKRESFWQAAGYRVLSLFVRTDSSP
ncbi:MAG TPA: septum formation initiator family protein [Armatimonadota bacterium]|nr:septum formation initiator family protein [Armatimonadota bacterium]